MSVPYADDRIVVDPALGLAHSLAPLLPTLDIVEDVAASAAAAVAVLSVGTARIQLPAIPASTTVIVIAGHQDRDESADLYDVGADMVIIEPPIEETAARIRAVVRHVRQLHPVGRRVGCRRGAAG
jgi:DNA-binding response OmpR family regulator